MRTRISETTKFAVYGEHLEKFCKAEIQVYRTEDTEKPFEISITGEMGSVTTLEVVEEMQVNSLADSLAQGGELVQMRYEEMERQEKWISPEQMARDLVDAGDSGGYEWTFLSDHMEREEFDKLWGLDRGSEMYRNGVAVLEGCGCLHKEIGDVFPALKEFFDHHLENVDTSVISRLEKALATID